MNHTLDPSTHTDQPTTDAAPSERADQAAEAVRALIHATLAGSRGYVDAAEVAAVIAFLHVLAGRLPQALHQAARWLAESESRGTLLDVTGSTPGRTRATTANVIVALTSASTAAASLAVDLAAAHQGSARLATVLDVDAPVPFILDEGSPRGRR